MIEKLIARTNTPEFYQDSDLKFISHTRISHNKSEFIFSINQISYDIPIEYEEWKITCEEVKAIQGFSHDILLPYVKMQFVENHPLLWAFNENHPQFAIEGIPANLSELMGDLFLAFEEKTGNWIKVNDHFWNSKKFFSIETKKQITVPEPLVKTIEDVIKKHNLTFKIVKENSRNQNLDYRLSKVLIFGNSDVSSNDFSFNQHYIIAEEFFGERIK
ncbi:hypothetical protein [Flavobacterium microcysteis]